ncbi:Fc.00g009240.m01.CDS01 [Cosmosporella sp. VM-42]
MNCSLCWCLGFSSPSHWNKDQTNKTRVSPTRQKREIIQSAKDGCHFCDLVCQASSLLRSAASDPPISISVYRNFPAEIHSMSPDEYYDVVEIYASFSMSKHYVVEPVALRLKLNLSYLDEPNELYPELARDVPSRSDSEGSLNFLETSYETCLKEHTECQQRLTHLPKRVVDISSLNYRLVEPQQHETGTYAALSYCWGGWASKVLTSHNITQLKGEIIWEDMPPCFKNAAVVARRLDISYLWIDTMCIVQDDKGDWEAESAKMADVYGNAAVVIAASSSPSPPIPFLAERTKYFGETLLNMSAPLQDRYSSMTFKARRKASLGMHAKLPRTGPQDPLESRAWALQERELATRLVSFTGAEIQWRCNRMSSCECCPRSCPPNSLITGHKKACTTSANNDPYIVWHQAVENYTSRNLTFASDRLPALSGLAQRFGNLTGATYIAGMWKQHLLEDLSWQRYSRTSLQPVLQYLAPTFSWASILNAADYQPARDGYEGIRVYHSEIIDAHSKATGGLLGRTIGGSLTIRGPVISATLCSPKAGDAQSYKLLIGSSTFKPDTFQRTSCEFSVDALPTSFEFAASGDRDRVPALGRCTSEATNHEPVTGTVLLLSLYSIVHATYRYELFLLLGRSRTEPAAYERLGIGTGKIYSSESTEQDPPLQIRPFEWLRVQSGPEGRAVGEFESLQIQIV